MVTDFPGAGSASRDNHQRTGWIPGVGQGVHPQGEDPGDPLRRQHFGGGPVGDQAAVLDHGDPVGIPAGQVEVVEHGEHAEVPLAAEAPCQAGETDDAAQRHRRARP